LLNRETGVKPVRSRHCKVERFIICHSMIVIKGEGMFRVEAESGDLPCVIIMGT
jgi:hypothetical protein